MPYTYHSKSLRGHREQPSVPTRINWLHPLAGDIKAIFDARDQHLRQGLSGGTSALFGSNDLFTSIGGHTAYKCPDAGATQGLSGMTAPDIVTGQVQVLGVVYSRWGNSSGEDFQNTIWEWRDGTDGFGLCEEDTGEIMVFTNGGNTIGNGLPSPTPRKWHHILAVFDQGADTIKLFMDGRLRSTVTSYTDNSSSSGSYFSPWRYNLGTAVDRYVSFAVGMQTPDYRGDEHYRALSEDLFNLLKPAVDFPVFFSDASALSLARISAMHFQRHYEPIAMGE